MLTRIVVVCGNGLSIDLTRSYAPAALGGWDTQRPLSWPVVTPGDPSTPLRTSLPLFDAALRRTDVTRESSDFERCAVLVREFERRERDNAAGRRWSEACDTAIAALEFQMRHFLCVAYAQFQEQVDQVDLRAWRWAEWFYRHRGTFELIVSFNYDLVVERACESRGLPVDRIQVVRIGPEHDGVRIFKPHGSVDFNYSSNALRVTFPYPYGDKWVVGDIDAPLDLVGKSELSKPRLCASIVLPTQSADLTFPRWIGPYYDQMVQRLGGVDYCVLAGLSYWEPDRVEIDKIIDALPPSAHVIVANPFPPPDLLRALAVRGRPTTLWTAGPEPLPLLRRPETWVPPLTHRFGPSRGIKT